MKPRTALAALFALIPSLPAAAQGLVIPDEPDLPPLALVRHDVRVDIDSQAAATTVVQVFANHTDRRLEAQYVFPIPKGAAVSRFVLTVGGEEKIGEVVEKDRARQIYAQLIQRAQDPGLVEHLGGNLFRASLAVPAGARTAVTLRFDQVLAAERGLAGYLYPVRTAARRGPAAQGEGSLEVALRSPRPLANIYSPSHAIRVDRRSPREARIALTEGAAAFEKDFQLYYSAGESAVGLDLVAHRPDAGAPGTFMLLLSPRGRIEEERLVERDLVFVLDTSGSMRGEKFRQAQAALRHCIGKLNAGDRFNLVRFSSDVDTWRAGWESAAERRHEALAWVDTLLADGGTNIAGALDAALAFPRDPARPFVVVFLTDGKPTIGDRDPARLIARAGRARQGDGGASVRLFTWGVGYDVDTHLLDGLAESGGGASEYVRPEEDIAAKVAAFCDRTSRPVLSHVALEAAGGIQLVQTYPRTLPDLYAGGQLVLFGRYTGAGAATLKLTGRINGRAETIAYEASFPAVEPGHAFIEPLWARRRIGNLLDTIRLHGETPELVEDVVRLAKEHGVQTPYTSYVAGAAGEALAQAGGPPAPRLEAQATERRRFDEATRALTVFAGKGGREAGSGAAAAARPAPSAAAPAADYADQGRKLEEGFRLRDGREAVEAAAWLRRMKEADAAGAEEGAGGVRRAGGTRFFAWRELWVDERFEARCALTEVKFGSVAYFRLLELRPELADVFKLGTAVVYVTSPGKALVIGPTGEEALTDGRIAGMFGA